MDRHREALAALSALLAVLLLSACAGLPSLAQRSSSQALSEAEAAETKLGGLVEPLIEAHAGKSGVHLLIDPHDAFAARTRLADAAERTIDAQSYIWRADETGLMLFNSLRKAADRGVRVRLLLDDYNTSGMDALLARINAHENIEVRLFNPFTVRTPRFWQILTDMSRINRRMHNKTFTVDNAVTILGGRNVADEYFGATDTLFSDVDVLALGPVVNKVSRSFDRYWRSDSSYPAELILEPEDDAPPGRMANRPDDYLKTLVDRNPVDAIRDRDMALCWARTELVVDDPAKGLGQADDDDLVLAQLREVLGPPQSRLTMISSYFIPTRKGVDALVGLARRGVSVRVLTNSMAATDEGLVHSGYAKWRDDLLAGGVRLYEMERGVDDGASPSNITAGPYGSASATLHAKTYAVDDHLVVGSFNADPRSVNLNTEVGVVVHCPELAEKVHGAFPERVMRRSYEVRLDDDGNLYWLERTEDGVTRHDREPDTTFWQRALLPVYSLLPIDGLL